jgi:hypothetical protein
LNYELPPDASRILREKLKEEDEFRRKFAICWQQTFYDSLNYRLTRGMNVILSILGLPGTGKSFAGLYIAKYISKITDVEFPDTAKNIVFTYNEFLDVMKQSRPRETIVQDEQRVLGVGFGSRSLAEEIQDVERIIRKRQNNMIYISPTLESHLHLGILEPLGINYASGVCRIMFYDNKEIPRGRIYTRKPNEVLLESYGKKKDVFIEKIINRNVGDHIEAIERMMQALLSDDAFINLSNKPKRLLYIAKKYPNLPAQIHEWLAELTAGTK